MAGVAKSEAGIDEAVVVVEEATPGIEEGVAEAVAVIEEGVVAVEEDASGSRESVAVVPEDKSGINEGEVDGGGIAAVVSGLGETGSVVEDAVEGLREDSGGREVE